MNLIPVLFYSILLLTSLYFFTLMKIWYAWKNIPVSTELDTGDRIKISVIIASRNEDNTLPDLLNDLNNQTYSKKMYTVIVVDDHSENKVSSLPDLKKYLWENIVVSCLPEGKSGKKSALIHGAQISQAELLLFTDADCRLQPDWIRSHTTKFSNEGPGLIIGLVDYSCVQGFLKNFFRFDFLSLVISGAGSSASGRNTLCNGANLSIRRDLYLKLAEKLHPHVPSGDDVFLLHEVKKLKNETISVLKSKHSIVKTHSPGSLTEFMNQRVRWTSKSKHYNDLDTILLSLLVFFTNLAIISIPFLYYKNPPEPWYLVFLILSLKLIADGFILGSGLNYFGRINHLWLLPLFEIFYPIYILAAVAGGIFNKYSWKSR